MSRKSGSTRGFARTASLLTERVRTASESRGFAQSRVLTHWPEIAGADTARICRPVEVTYGRGAVGATLTILTTGPMAPMLEMQKEDLRARVNAVYGYNAIARIRITQTAPTGFDNGKAMFAQPDRPVEQRPDPALAAKAAETAAGIGDAGLRAALERLAGHVLSDKKSGA